MEDLDLEEDLILKKIQSTYHRRCNNNWRI